MLQCAYAIFCEEASVNVTSKQVSAKEFFSNLTIEKAGTAKFSFIVGVWGIPNGKTAALELDIATPDDRGFTGKWTSPESKDDTTVQTAIFNCSNMQFNEQGQYVFSVFDKKAGREIAKRILKVTFHESEES